MAGTSGPWLLGGSSWVSLGASDILAQGGVKGMEPVGRWVLEPRVQVRVPGCMGRCVLRGRKDSVERRVLGWWALMLVLLPPSVYEVLSVYMLAAPQ